MLEQLENYRPGPLESQVVEFYRKMGVRSPQDIDLQMWADDADIHIHELARPSMSFKRNGIAFIAIDSRMPWEQQRVELAHELAHLWKHVGRQEDMDDYGRMRQEHQADHFAFYALVPTFMLANCITQASSRAQLVSQLAYTFDVPEPFMDERLKLLERRLYEIAMEDHMASAVAEASVGYDYSYRHPANPRIELLMKNGNIVGQRRRADI